MDWQDVTMWVIYGFVWIVIGFGAICTFVFFIWIWWLITTPIQKEKDFKGLRGLG